MKNFFTIILISLMFVGIAAAQATPDPVSSDGVVSMVMAMVKQVINSPASLLVIIGLSILAWLIEVSIVSSKIIPAFCVLGGAAGYWLFSSPASVPKEFPHPIAVLIVNGLICGIVAFAIHAQVIKRFLSKPEPKP